MDELQLCHMRADPQTLGRGANQLKVEEHMSVAESATRLGWIHGILDPQDSNLLVVQDVLEDCDH
eukprot:CAMPEP_0184311698 /NCGR_PEP_ID=MMETSP1049-20130417/44137_1 /TAXON_ID=77928 /ORGANISM="Proteomonas sulcata, Strain CCMP704" /LENGTH=64 /DNA_ID=CAMNT_0026627287 /DNA_START=212 /DNA_END=406 /DNA_ORIENTATION=+